MVSTTTKRVLLGRSRWYRLNLWLHRWCGLVVTVPFLVLCLTGTVLIFRDEIDALTNAMPATESADQLPDRPLQEAVDNFLEAHAGERVVSLGIDPKNHPGVLLMLTGLMESEKFQQATTRYAQLATGRMTAHESRPASTVTGFLLEMHARWFLGIAGELFGALIAFLIVIALTSGAVVYWPHIKKVAFGVLRRGRGPRLRQLDLHNLIGSIVLGWAFVVAMTGVLLGFGSVATGLWSYSAFAGMRGEVAHSQVDPRRPPVDADAARHAAELAAPPGWRMSLLIFPNTEYSTPTHYTALVAAPSGLEERLFRVALVDAASGEVSRTVEMPWYMKAIMMSQPLHFGNYGGMPLKILWTVCVWLTFFITANGAWMWWDRKRAHRRAEGGVS